jgi:hypothetical protein
MKHSLFEYLKYNNISYFELKNDDEKKKLEKFVNKIKQENLEKTILSFTPAHKYNIREFESGVIDVISDFNAADLERKLMRLWIHKDDPKFHL